MADRSFEQQVHKELAGLRIKPDDAVWINIEAALNKEKKRRFLWIFFLLAGLSGLTFLWAYLNWNSVAVVSKADHSVAVTPSINPSKNIDNHNTAQKDNQKPESVPGQKNDWNGNENKQPVKEWISDKLKKDKSPVSDFGYTDSKKLDNTVTGETPPKNNNSPKKSLGDAIIRSSQITMISEAGLQTEKSEERMEKQDIQKETSAIHAQITDTLSLVNKTESVGKDSSGIETKSKLLSKKKWQWGMHAGLGKGNTIDGLNPSQKNALVNSALSAPGGGSQALPLISAPQINGAFSFQAGVEISRQIGKRNRLTFSLDYQLYQTRTQTGNRIDSIAFISSYAVYNNNRYFYSTGSSNTYTSYYHLLAAGAGLYFPRKLFHSIPVRWNIGLNMQLLVATNGLLYDASSGKFFQNNALLAKFQPQVSAGFDIGMGKSSPVFIGPSLQYSLSKLSSTGAADKHLFFAGAKVSFIFPEKKRKMQR